MFRLLVLGGGRMGSALLGGLLRSGWCDQSSCAVVERRPEVRELLQERYPDLAVLSEPVAADALVVAVKPADAHPACALLPAKGYPRVLSVVAGVTIAQLEQWLWPGAAIIRAMPNTPALLGTSASAIAAGPSATEDDLEWAETVLSSIGVVVRLPERLLDAATGLSGSGPAYVFLVAEALVEAGVLEGLDREVSRVLTVQTILGAAKMLAESGESAEVLRAAVTSPGGTTAAALRELERGGVRAAFLEAVSASAAKSREIAGAP
jgi:pyrroline-5-carboxylate reductase